MPWRNQLSRARIAIGLLALAVCTLGVWVGARTNYFPALNDFWPLLFQADMLDWTTRASFANGFFPPGYPVFLRLLEGQHILASAFLSNVFLGGLTLIATHAMGQRSASATAAVVGAALVAFHPLVFSVNLTTGPDAGCLFFTSTGFFLVMAGGESISETKRRKCWWLAGCLFFLAAMWRFNGLVFAVAAVFSAGLVYRRWSLWRAASGIAAALMVLVFLTLLPGMSAQLGRAQAFVVYEGIHPINWYHIPRDFPPTVAEVIRAEPAAFWKAYVEFNLPLIWVLLPTVVGVFLLRALPRRIAMATLVLQAIYLPIVGVGTSIRGFAPVLPATMLCIVLLLDDLRARWLARWIDARVATVVVFALALGVVAKPWFQANRAFVEASIYGYEWRRAVEMELRSDGVTSPLQVFGEAGFHFVADAGPGWYSYMPRFNGGWPQVDLYRLHETLPEMTTTDLDGFIADCDRGGITHIVLSGTSGYLFPALGEIFQQTRTHPRLDFVAERAGMRIFRLAK
jgi:hypothetical protein